MESPLSYTRCEELWLEDGNIVLRAEKTVFLVHRSVLSLASPIFRDIFAVSQLSVTDAEAYDGIPLVALQDNAFDITQFLKGLLYPGYADRESGKRFATLAALLRLGTKYNVPYFREIAIRKLLAAFPVTLPVFDARRIEDHIADWHKYEYHTYAAISLSMECRVSAALPVLFCMLSPDVGRDTRGLLRQDALCARRGWGCNVLLNGKAASVEWM